MAAAASIEKPFVTVIVPCRNEAAFLGACLDSILENDYPRDRMEVLVADGMSEDGTAELIARYAARDARVRRIENPSRVTPAGLNRAIEAARGEIVIRVDAHSEIAPRYAGLCVDYLQNTDAENVGGAMRTVAVGTGPFAEAIRLALTHWFGVGNSRFRTGASAARWVDTVFGGCWRRETLLRVGKFNERLARGQDMEFNIRLRKAGGKILLVPEIESRYFARAGLADFIRHNWTNGVWAVLPFAYSGAAPVRWRHLAPLTFVAALAASAAAAVFWPPLRWLPAFAAAPYIALNAAVSLSAAMKEKDPKLAMLLPWTFAALHLPYGLGSAWGAIRLARIGLRRALKEESA
ncbi:MAG TPA: glycosyltransferase family 2 protein [Bryobacteraceae bacterium]|nr:glycosyltransferase family 2 protein [Bryobacteraceae bacterium]